MGGLEEGDWGLHNTQYFMKLPSFHAPLPGVYFFTFISTPRFPPLPGDRHSPGQSHPAAPSHALQLSGGQWCGSACGSVHPSAARMAISSPSPMICPALAPSLLPRPTGAAVCARALNQRVPTVAKGTSSPRSLGESVPAPPLPTAEPTDQLCPSLNSCPPSPTPSTPILWPSSAVPGIGGPLGPTTTTGTGAPSGTPMHP